MAHLDEGREKTRPALRHESGADVEITEKEKWHGRKQEPRLDEDDLDRDDRGETPEQLGAAGPADPAHRRSGQPLRAEDELQRDDLAEIESDERGRGDRAGDDDLTDGPGDAIEHRHDHELEGHGGHAGADRLSGGIADDANERLAGDEVVHQTGGSGDERERSRRKQHHTRKDRDLGRGQLHVRGDADRPKRQQDAERPDVKGDGRGLVTEHVLDAERHERNRDQARDRDENVRARRDRSHRRPSSIPKRITGWFRPGIRRLSVD